MLSYQDDLSKLEDLSIKISDLINENKFENILELDLQRKKIIESIKSSIMSDHKMKLSQIINLLIAKLEQKNFFKPTEKRSSMIKNINNLFYRMEPDDKELRILGSLIGSLSKNKKKLN